MPPAPKQPWTPQAISILALIILGVLLLVYYVPALLIVIVAFGLLTLTLTMLEDRRLDRIEALRPNESICTFALSFDRRAVDPWIIRAVWQELQPYFGRRADDFLMRASDQIEEDLRIDWEDLGVLLETIACRARRSLKDLERNPLYDRVKTVGDLVEFINHQPALGAA